MRACPECQYIERWAGSPATCPNCDAEMVSYFEEKNLLQSASRSAITSSLDYEWEYRLERKKHGQSSIRSLERRNHSLG